MSQNELLFNLVSVQSFYHPISAYFSRNGDSSMCLSFKARKALSKATASWLTFSFTIFNSDSIPEILMPKVSTALVASSLTFATAASAGAATLSEDRGQFRNVIVLASLPMTQSFYGLIVMIIILNTVVPKLPEAGGAGFAVFGIGLMTAAAECFSAIHQGNVCASGISLLPKTKGQIFTNAVMLAVFVELIGVLGLVFSIMALNLHGLM